MPHLTALELISCDFGRCVQDIMPHLRICLTASTCQIKTLALDGTKIGDEGMEVINGLLLESKITSLSLNGCGIGPLGAGNLLSILEKNPDKLETLLLDENKVGSMSYFLAGEVMKKSKTLRVLDLGCAEDVECAKSNFMAGTRGSCVEVLRSGGRILECERLLKLMTEYPDEFNIRQIQSQDWPGTPVPYQTLVDFLNKYNKIEQLYVFCFDYPADDTTLKDALNNHPSLRLISLRDYLDDAVREYFYKLQEPSIQYPLLLMRAKKCITSPISRLPNDLIKHHLVPFLR